MAKLDIDTSDAERKLERLTVQAKELRNVLAEAAAMASTIDDLYMQRDDEASPEWAAADFFEDGETYRVTFEKIEE